MTLAELREKARAKAKEVYEEKKEKVKSSYKKWQEAKPQETHKITRKEFSTKGIISGGMFFQKPHAKKSKSSKTVTISLGGKKLRVKTVSNKKKERSNIGSLNLDIMNVKGGIFQ